MQKLVAAIVMFLVVGVSAACGGDEVQKETLTFNAHDLARDEDGMSVFRLKVTNDGEETVAIDEFGASFELKLLTKFGDLVAQEGVEKIGPLAPGETSTLVEWTGELDGNYYLYWGAPGYGAAEVHFFATEGGGARAGKAGILIMAYKDLEP
jgi:hypothetical protein